MRKWQILMILGLFTLTAVLALIPRFILTSPIDPYSGVLIVQTDDGQGSCFVVACRGDQWYAITAGHVIESVSSITIDNEQYQAEVVRVGSPEDIALIRFESPEEYKIYSFTKAEVGKSCITIGWSGDSKLVYKGHIVATDFNGRVAANGGIVPGCSGGALLNPSYQVLGVTVAVPIFQEWAFDSTALYVPARFAEAMVIAENLTGD
jgi:S1-C subfamily serine protease